MGTEHRDFIGNGNEVSAVDMVSCIRMRHLAGDGVRIIACLGGNAGVNERNSLAVLENGATRGGCCI